MSPERPHQIELLVFKGQHHYTRALLGPGDYSIGQDAKNNITIDELTISSTHARLLIHSMDEITLQDLGSANGTFVDGTFAEEALPVTPSSNVQVGACSLRLREKVAL